MIKTLSLLVSLLGQPVPQPPETTSVQREYIQSIERVKNNDTANAETYNIVMKSILNTPDSILSLLTQDQTISSILMIHSAVQTPNYMKSYDGLNWAPQLNLDSLLFYPDSIAKSIAAQVVTQGNPELFILFCQDEALKTAVIKATDYKKRELEKGLIFEETKKEYGIFSLPVVNRNGQFVLNVPYSKNYEDVVAASALFMIASGADIFSLKIIDERYFKIVTLLEHISERKIPLTKKLCDQIAERAGVMKLYANYATMQNLLIFEKDSVMDRVRALEGDKSFYGLKDANGLMHYKEKIYSTDSVTVFAGCFNSFVLKNCASLQPDDSLIISFEYAGDLNILKGYLVMIEKLSRNGGKEKAEELLALLLFAEKNSIPVCDELLKDRYSSVTGSLLLGTENNAQIVEIVDKGSGNRGMDLSSSNHDISYNFYSSASAIIKFMYDPKNSEGSVLFYYFDGKRELNIPYENKFSFSMGGSQAEEFRRLLQRFEDAYKNSTKNEKNGLLKKFYDELTKLNNQNIRSAEISDLFAETIHLIQNIEARTVQKPNQTKNYPQSQNQSNQSNQSIIK